MKIALVSPYDFAYPGGVVNHIMALERCLTAMGHDVSVIAPVSKAISVFEGRFIPIGRPRSVPTNGSIARITLSLQLEKRVKQVLAEEKFDIIHLHEPFAPMLCTSMLHFSNTVNVGTFHATLWNPIFGFLSPIGVPLFRRRASKLDGKIAVSPPAAAFATKYIPGPYTIIPNGIDLKRFAPEVPKVARFSDGKKNILFVGRLEPRKGCIYLLRAFEQAKKTAPDIRLIIVGPGSRLRDRYARWVISHHLERDVVFAGFVTNEELPSYYQTADIFCSPATGRESFGIVLLEAMAMGKPVIASNIEGYASVITSGTDGILVPPKDDRELGKALMSLLNDEKRCRELGEKGRETAQKYRWEDVANRIFAFYLETLEKKGKKRQMENPEAAVV